VNDHDLLIRIDENMKMVLAELKKGEIKMAELETRISTVEGFKHTLLGIAASISFAVSVLGAWLMSHFRMG